MTRRQSLECVITNLRTPAEIREDIFQSIGGGGGGVEDNVSLVRYEGAEALQSL